MCLSVYSTLPLLKYLPARLPNLFFFPLWVSAFSYENLFPSFVSLYLPQFCVCGVFFVFFCFLPTVFSFGQMNHFLASGGFS